MAGFFVILGFVGMILAPCAIAYRARLDKPEEDSAEEPAELPSLQFFIQPPSELSFSSEYHAGPFPEFGNLQPLPSLAPIRVSSLQEIADRAAAAMYTAQAAAAQARAHALAEFSLNASRRSDQAARLAESAERELARATQASQSSQAFTQSEAHEAQARLVQDESEPTNYLPSDHPSLDFPRSRSSARRVA